MSFTKTPPKWDNAGQEPSLDLQTNGFAAGYKPPAPYFNYLFHQYSECIKELQDKSFEEFAPSGYGLGEMAKDITGQDIVQVARGKSGFYQGRNITNAPSSWFYYFFVNAGKDKTNIVAVGSAGKLYSTQFDNYVTTASWNEYVKASYGTVTSSNADFAEVAEWSDGNPNNEDRVGYFVSVSKTEIGITMSKATTSSDVRGVTIAHPAFAANASDDKYDENDNLLKQYNYVAFAGFATVIDNGTCTVNERCISDDNGCAVPSDNSMGYQVIDRVDDTHILILVEPNADMLNRIKSDVLALESDVSLLNQAIDDTDDRLSEKLESELDTQLAGANAPEYPELATKEQCDTNTSDIDELKGDLSDTESRLSESITEISNMLGYMAIGSYNVVKHDNAGQTIVDGFSVVAGKTYYIYAKTDVNVQSNDTCLIGLGYNGKIGTSDLGLYNGSVYTFNATQSAEASRVYLVNTLGIETFNIKAMIWDADKYTLSDVYNDINILKEHQKAYIYTQFDGVDGKITNSLGNEMVNTNYMTIKNVPVLPHQKCSITGFFGGADKNSSGNYNSGGVSGYDLKGNFVCAVYDGKVAGLESTATHQYDNSEFTIPDNVYYICFSSRKDGNKPIELNLMRFDDGNAIFKETKMLIKNSDNEPNDMYLDELNDTILSVNDFIKTYTDESIVLAIFTDLHHDKQVDIDTIDDTIDCIIKLNKSLHFDSIYSLGDMINGQNDTKEEALRYISDVVSRADKAGDSFFLLGNHDTNAQSTWSWVGNLPLSNKLTAIESARSLDNRKAKRNHKYPVDFYVDYEQYRIRVVSIGADGDTVNEIYYKQDTADWLNAEALDTNYDVIVLSHYSTKSELSYQHDVKNGNIIENALNAFISNGGNVIALIHGHNHADLVTKTSTMNWHDVSIGCAKFDDSMSGSSLIPSGSIVYSRNENDYTKVLFDVLCVNKSSKTVKLIRCGAGVDREFTY